MLAITIQHKSVLNKVLAGSYRAEYRPGTDLVEPYRFMAHEYGWTSCPIFLAPVGYKVNLYGATFGKESVCMLFDIPEDVIKLQNYYTWTDFIFYVQMPDELSEVYKYPTVEDLGRAALTGVLREKDCAQATVYELRKEWLLGATSDLDIFDKYNGSGGNYVLDEQTVMEAIGMFQGDPEVFIQKEIEIGLADGIDIRPYLKEGMSGKEVRDLRMSLWAKSVTKESELSALADNL